MQLKFLPHTFTFRSEYSNQMFAFAEDLFGSCFPLSCPSIILEQLKIFKVFQLSQPGELWDLDGKIIFQPEMKKLY